VACNRCGVTDVLTVHTAELPSRTRDAARALLKDVFAGTFSDGDWEHALGGVHALVYEGDELVGHGSVVQRRLLHGGRALRTGYVEAVGVRADRRRRGHGAALMRALERVIRGAYDLGALAATDDGASMYAALGWQRWRGPTSALTPGGIARTPNDDGGVHVLPVTVDVDLDGAIVCDWRDGELW
jgi:aminoglycoside 2'-N-acetyltransferase I